ncbi:hypothetical protein ACA29_15290 [Lederbergia galactosidilytica]|uniref:Uncharacterized protein n=1 Tax=Lederbergia galactosidilytica TaxID=217031 RepID=A0A0Q9XU41_9BACI|nr:hypothetical protein ACA29_15290 [Lederbergia galactosidilytica]
MGDGREEKQWSSLVWIGLIIATTFLLYACNKTNEKVLKEDHLTDEANKNTVVNDEPITLSIGWYQGDEYWDEFVQDLGEEFPVRSFLILQSKELMGNLVTEKTWKSGSWVARFKIFFH